jgi:hypothetical protein
VKFSPCFVFQLYGNPHDLFHFMSLTCTFNGFSCNTLDLAINQKSKALTVNIFDKLSQPEYAVHE